MLKIYVFVTTELEKALVLFYLVWSQSNFELRWLTLRKFGLGQLKYCDGVQRLHKKKKDQKKTDQRHQAMQNNVIVIVLEQLTYPEISMFDNGYHGDDVILREHRLGGEVIVSIQHLDT